MAANFENFLISPDFSINFRNSLQVSKDYLKSSESYGQKPFRGPKDLNRVKLIPLSSVAFIMFSSSLTLAIFSHFGQFSKRLSDFKPFISQPNHHQNQQTMYQNLTQRTGNSKIV